MPRVRVAIHGTPNKTAWLDPKATDGAVIGENLFVRNADGTLTVYDPGTAAVAGSTTPAGTVTSALSGSNSGYPAASSPAAAPTNFDLDLSMIAGLGNTSFPTLNYVLIGNGVEWVAKPLTGDASILATGAFTLSVEQRRYTGTASGTNTYAVTASPVPTAYAAKQLFYITFTNANTGASTLNANTLGAKAIQLYGAALTGGEIPAGATCELMYDGAAFQLIAIGIATASVTNAKLANMAAHTIKANITGSAAAPTDASLSSIIVADSLLTTKGDFLTFSTVPVRKAIGTNGYLIVADSTQAEGWKWAPAPSSAGFTVGLEKDRPAANSGSIYQATDSGITYFSDQTSWYVAGYGPDKRGFGNISDSNFIQSSFSGATIGPTMSNPYTILIGFKVLSLPGTSNQVLIRNFQTSGSDGFFLGTSLINANKFRVQLIGVNSSSANEFTSISALTTGDHALALSYNGSSLDMVLDGGTVQQIACTGTYTAPGASAVTTIGRYSTTGTGASGFVFSYVYGYASALSTADKQTLTTTPSNYFPGVISASPAWAFNAKIPGSGSSFRTWGSAVPSDGSSWLANNGTLKVYSL